MDTIETTHTTIGAAVGGGFAGGCILLDGHPFQIINAPKAEGQLIGVWSKKMKRVDGALSLVDGLANTRAMAEAGSEIAKKVLALRIGGHDDWYIPALFELEPNYRYLKPTTDKNWTHLYGANPASIPVTFPYTVNDPQQTAVEIFRKGGAEAFEPMAHMTSSQYEGLAVCAWIQLFGGGTQDYGHKDNEYLVRPVRRVTL